MRERLFDEDVGVRPQSEQRFLDVAHRRRANQHEIGLETCERFTVIRKQFAAYLALALPQCLGIGVAKGEPLQSERLKIPRVPAADRTTTNYQSPISYPISHSGHEIIQGATPGVEARSPIAV